MPRPDSNGYTKFIISAGVFLVIAAFVVPGFVLRDTGVLTISRADLEKTTPTARHELERRQAIARDAGHVAPYLWGAFLIGGLVLIGIGMPRLKRQEQTADEHARAEVDKLHGELRPQTEDERAKRVSAEFKEEKEAQPIAPAPPSPAADKAESPVLSTPQQWAKVESDVLARLARIAPPNYELQSQVRLGGEKTPYPLLLDALLISEVDRLPDIVVEIKYARRGIGAHVDRRIREAREQLRRYLDRYRRASIGWLILYVDKELTAQQRDTILVRMAEVPDLKVSIVTPDSLARLELPVES